ncbi:GIY-YIG nuclease family protein [Haladaptatus sp. AB643]|uniref:GIY-YIG nuclease family protein n=1 Tax=Haladaptatus sp. AB643 TaxID=2934174 RepID=UPI00209BC49B|nr:GIY-YIG nuclease family protein [Haladaptatus sp. AB643]MCO8246609.1 GIY-YIG nuclease family protein [Haladaptatus sp. AB643]
MKGTYTLLVELAAPVEVEFGAKGTRKLDSGWYAYTGSAFGQGGFSRIARHGRVASGENDARHWHIDYLLGHDGSALVDDVRTEGEDVECAVARELGEEVEAVSGIGASDCDCDTHLHFSNERERLETVIRRAHE